MHGPEAGTAQKKQLYFAYGSNMSSIELHDWCPSAVALGPARLSGYRLAFTAYAKHRQGGVADIVRLNPGDPGLDYDARSWAEDKPFPLTPVWGVLWEIPDNELAELHRKEGYTPGRPASECKYVPVQVKVLLHREPVNKLCEAFAYEVVEKAVHIPPGEQYLDIILQGAVEHYLPSDYIMGLSRVARFVPL